MRKYSFSFISNLLILIVCFLINMASAESIDNKLSISTPQEISGYRNNPLIITAPESGKLTLEIRDETTLYRSLEAAAIEGKNQVIWDGLGWNEERLAKKSFVIYGTLEGDSGRCYRAETRIKVGSSQQAILFALPSDPVVYSESDDWFLELKLLFTDQLTAEFYNNTNALVIKTTRETKGGRVNQISWAALSDKKRIIPGTYRVRIYGKLHPSNFKEINLEIREGKRPNIPLHLTGEIMPDRTDSDAEIWEKMMAPATVIDIRNVSHQRVYDAPRNNSRVLGTLHGQSQSVSVLEIQEKWVRIKAWNHERGELIEGWVPRKVLKVVEPQRRYGLLIDKKRQTLTLYENGKKIDTLLVSTGRMAKGELYQETAAGSFLTDVHMSDYSTNGLKYDFVIRYDGGNLLHQIPYDWNTEGKKDMLPGEMYLGTKASHACIRIQEKPSDTGLNAYWFWTHLPYHTRVIVLDDPEERRNLERIVTGNTPALEDGLASSWTVDDQEDTNHQTIVITFGGDAVLGGRENYYGNPAGMPAFLEKEGTGWPFEKIKDIFAEDDLTVVNLECVLKKDGEGEDITKQWRFRGLPEYVQILVNGRIELVNLANNHTIDYGETGYSETQESLEGLISWCGNGQNTVIEIRGYKFGFAGCRETNYIQFPGIIEHDIRELKEKGAEYIIYQCHWGTEYEGNHNTLQEAMARACQRAGADLVIGHHPHVVQGVDWIEQMPVVYSLGNLVFGGTINLTTYDAMLCQAVFYPERAENKAELKLIPLLTSGGAAQKINNYQPVVAEKEDALRILKKVQQDTGWLLTERVHLLY